MKRLIAILSFLFFVSTVFYSVCVYGKHTEEVTTIGIPEFHAIDFQVSHGNLYIKQGKTQSLEVRMDNNIISSLHADVTDGILKIYMDGYESARNAEFYVTVKDLNGVYLTGSNSYITGQETIKVDQIEVKNNLSTGKIILNLEANKIITELGSSGNIILSGRAKKHNISLTGSGNITSFDLICENCDVNIMGSGNAEVNVNKELNVNIMGSGGVIYKGDPVVKKQLLGSGFCKAYK